MSFVAQTPLDTGNKHIPHCRFLTFGIQSEDTCFCNPQVAAKLEAEWGQDLVDAISIAATPVEVFELWLVQTASKQIGSINASSPETKPIKLSDSPVAAPALPLCHPIPLRLLKPTFLPDFSPTFFPISYPTPQYTPTPEPIYLSQAFISSSVDPHTPASSSCSSRSSSYSPRPRSSCSTSCSCSCTPSAGTIGPTRCTRQWRRGYRPYVFEGSINQLAKRRSWRCRTRSNGSPSYWKPDSASKTGAPVSSTESECESETSSEGSDSDDSGPIPFKLNRSSSNCGFRRTTNLLLTQPVPALAQMPMPSVTPNCKAWTPTAHTPLPSSKCPACGGLVGADPLVEL